MCLYPWPSSYFAVIVIILVSECLSMAESTWVKPLPLLTFSRSCHRRCSVRKGALRNFTKFTGKQQCQSLFFNRVAGLKPATLPATLPVNLATFLRTPFLKNTSGRPLLFLSRKLVSLWFFHWYYWRSKSPQFSIIVNINN